MDAILGLDIGGTKLAAGVADRAGRLLAESRRPAGVERGPEAMLADLIALARSVIEASGEQPAAVGVSVGGPLDPERGVVICPPGLPGWIDVPLAAILARALALPVQIENDANASALAEQRWGSGVGRENLLYVTVSTGIGAGVIAHGRLLRGVGCGAGEIGHMRVRPGGARCDCGGSGCVTAEAAGVAIARKAREAMAREPAAAARLRELCEGDSAAVTAERVAEAAREGDPLALAIWEDALDALATGIANAICTLAPERVVVGGGVAAAGDTFFGPLRAMVAERVHLAPAYAIAIVPSAFGAENAGLMGAFAVAADILQNPASEERTLTGGSR